MGSIAQNRHTLAWLARMLGLFAATLLVAFSAQAEAQRNDDPRVAPGRQSAEYWREVRQGVPGVTQIKGAESAVMINSQGQEWRKLRNEKIIGYGWKLIAAMVSIIALFYLLKGPLKLSEPPTGRMMMRFSPFERFVHWGTAISFVLMGLTGLAILFGKLAIAPIFGAGGLAGVLALGKLIHNYLGPIFLAFTLLMIFAFARDNVWQNHDAQWIARGGGLFSGGHVPSGRFNFGEKTWFWIGVTILGLIVAGSGLVLNFPNYGQLRETMQLANVVHSISAVVLVTLSLGHIYMGTIGVQGAFDSMRRGEVDETWAKEHHEIWYHDIKTGRSGHP